MKKSNNETVMIIGIVAIVGIVAMLLYFNTDFFHVIDRTTVEKLDNPPEYEDECELELSTYYAETGDTITATIREGPNTYCTAYVNYNSGGWTLIDDGKLRKTNSAGVYSESRVVGAAGTYVLAAICGDCVAIANTLTVTDPDDSDGSDGSDGDGGDGGDGSTEVYCISDWPRPDSQSDCGTRVGCSSNQYCLFVDGGLVGTNKCECVEKSSCDSICRYNGFNDGWCDYNIDRTPCDGDSLMFDGNIYCGGPLEGNCCCN